MRGAGGLDENVTGGVDSVESAGGVVVVEDAGSYRGEQGAVVEMLAGGTAWGDGDFAQNVVGLPLLVWARIVPVIPSAGVAMAVPVIAPAAQTAAEPASAARRSCLADGRDECRSLPKSLDSIAVLSIWVE